MSFIDGMLDRGIPLKVFHFDCFWMKDFHWTEFFCGMSVYSRTRRGCFPVLKQRD